VDAGATAKTRKQEVTQMALLEDMFKGGNIVAGLAIGLGAAVVAPAVLPILRPLAKSVIKAGLIAYDQGRVALAELNEQAGDMIAEARAEITHAGDMPQEAEPASQAAARRTTGGRPRRTARA
jgi:hypothetical protein